MANKTMEIRSPLLNSATHRNNLRPGKDQWPEIRKALESIDRIGGLYDAIRRVHEANNPEETPTASAMRYEKQFNKTVAEARATALRAGEFLDGFAKDIKARALREAGLDCQPPTGPEIRASLRAMSPKDRDTVIMDAFERGDTELLSSIYGHNRVTWGGTTKPIDQHFNLHIDKAAPEARADREALDKVTEGLNLAVDAFLGAAEKWRDPLTAAKGFQEAEEFAAADAALKAFIEPSLREGIAPTV